VDDLGGRPPRHAYERPTARGLKFYEDNLALTALLCARSQITLMYVDQPVDERFALYDENRKAGLQQMRRLLRDFCAGHGIPLLSAHEGFDWTGLTPQDDVHPGKLGYDRLAGLLAPQILAASASAHAAR
jgi:hypothetical protein